MHNGLSAGFGRASIMPTMRSRQLRSDAPGPTKGDTVERKTMQQERRERLEALQASIPYPFKLKTTKEGEDYLIAVAKGRTIDTGSVEVSKESFGGVFSIFYRDERERESGFLFQEREENAVILISALCERLGMQPRII